MPRRQTARNPLFSCHRFADEVVTVRVPGYLRFKASYRDLAEILWELWSNGFAEHHPALGRSLRRRIRSSLAYYLKGVWILACR